MADNPFTKALKQRLFPTLRAEGFKGSGTTLRRQIGPVLHVFNVQMSTSENHCYLNLGAHLDFLPSAGEGKCNPATIKEYECVFRERIEPPSGSAFGWVYQTNPKAIEESVDFIMSEWENVGHAFFDRYTKYPDQFVELVKAGISTPPVHPIHALTAARIAQHLGLHEQASEIVERALLTVPPAATGLRRNLERVLVKAVSPN